MNRFDYWYVNDFFNNKDRKKISSFIEKNYNNVEDIKSQARNDNGQTKKKTKTLMIDWKKIKPLTYDLESKIYDINENVFGYTLNGFNNLSVVLLNIYKSSEKGEYDWHYDFSDSTTFDTKLTVLVNLSESYEGGDFLLFQGKQITVQEFKPGTLLLFKSYINHKVTPVTKGVRKTLTMFCHGPKFQ